MSASLYGILANAVLILHLGIVLFIIGGLCGWSWVRNFWLRAVHLLGIGYVAMEAWLGIVCPLTTLEQGLRERAGQAVYGGDFVAHWLRKFMFYQAEPWVFIVAYSSFGILVLLGWFWFPPAWPGRRRAQVGPTGPLA